MQQSVCYARAVRASSLRRRICAWCRRDLGALQHESQHDSYGICADCTECYFAPLYEHDVPTLTLALEERTYGEGPASARTLQRTATHSTLPV